MRKLTPLLLVTLIVAFVGSVWSRHRGDASGTATSGGSGSATPVADKGKGDAAKPAPLTRTLRTVALGWEFLAPGVIANDAPDGKPSDFKHAGLDVSFANATNVDDLESALAKGGGEATGADIAIMPLSSYVASYERLRALSLDVFFVVGWSHGREALYGQSSSALAKLPAAGTVKVAAAPGKPETFLALFLLDLEGVPASRIELVDPASHAPLAAIFRSSHQHATGKLLLTSADTPQLMPLVAVAPRGFIAAHGGELERWTRAWLGGVKRLADDVPAGGRLVATLPGAPPVVGIIEALGQIEFATLRENAVAVGLAGRGAITLEQSFTTTWRIWREAGVLTTPAPEVVPLHTGIVASLARTNPATAAEQPRKPSAATASDKRPEVLLVVRGPAGKLDTDAWIERVGFLAMVFQRQPLRVSIKGDGKATLLVADGARDRFNLPPSQILIGKGTSESTIEVLSQR
jgi:hypothetical protein